MAFPVFEVEFTRDGNVFQAEEVEAALAGLANPAAGITDLLVFAHGWNDDKADARALCQRFFDALVAQLARPQASPLAGRRFAVLPLLWPSKRFTGAEPLPGGAASAGAGEAEEMRVLHGLEAMRREPVRLGLEEEIDHHRQANLDLAKGLVPRLTSDRDAQQRFVELVRTLLDEGRPEPEDATEWLFSGDPLELLKRLGQPVPPPPLPAGRGTAAGVGTGGAGSRSDLASGVLAGARRLLNFISYYQRKERAGAVGQKGVAAVLRKVREKLPPLKLHLVGHSFGARVVTAATDALPAVARPATLTLLQATFSHNALAAKWDGQHDGFYRKVVSAGKVGGPILISHTKNDRALGVAYPLASRVAQPSPAALGDADDPYGGLGRHGAQQTPEATFLSLGEVGTAYPFAPGKVFNLKADAFIQDHSDIALPQVAWALLAAVAST